MDITTKTRFEESVVKARQISQHRVRIVPSPMNADLLPEGLSMSEAAITSWLTGRKVVGPTEIKHATGVRIIDLQSIVLDFDVGMMYYVYFDEV